MLDHRDLNNQNCADVFGSRYWHFRKKIRNVLHGVMRLSIRKIVKPWWLFVAMRECFTTYPGLEVQMASLRHCLFLAVVLSINVSAQTTTTPESIVKTVQVTPSVQQAEVGQKVKLSVTATDASGKVVNDKPSAFFAGPFDIAAVDDDGNVTLFGMGEVTVGAIVGGKPGIATFMVKPPSIKTI